MLSRRQEANIKSTSHKMLKRILPYLTSTDHGHFVKGILEEELIHHETQSVGEPIGALAICAIAILALLAGFVAGSL